MIDPWFSFFRIAWVSWTFWLSLLACKKVCIIAFLSRAVSNLPPFGEIVSHFRAYLTLYLERPIKCVVFICPQISVRFLLKTSIFTLIFLIRLSKISFCLHLCKLVGLDGLEPSTSRLSGARSNHLSYRPFWTHLVSHSTPYLWHCLVRFGFCLFPIAWCVSNSLRTFPEHASGACRWWRWRESNPWPPACRAGALPAELHPHIRVFALVPDNWITDVRTLHKYASNPVLHLVAVIAICALVFCSLLSNYGRISAPRAVSTTVSIERRWSSRTFRYGYLVTT